MITTCYLEDYRQVKLVKYKKEKSIFQFFWLQTRSIRAK
jgi:hypothetical protein